jgi:xanthine dehydrogenase YagS FAD-binding subunit
MKAFSYVTARTAETAVELVRPGGRFLAGGMDLVGALKDGLVEAERLVNVKALPALDTIDAGADRWTIGANVRLAALAAHAGVRAQFPALAEAAATVGSPQLRNLATVGGNLAQYSRCWYFRHKDLRCLKKGGNGCFARTGRNKYHAIFSGCPCVSPLVSHLAVALSALDASVVVQRGGSAVTLPIAEIYDDAWRVARVQNSLKPDDLILRVVIPVARAGSAFERVTEKSEFDWALVTCAAAVEISAGVVRRARVSLGCVAPIPYRDEKAEAALAGKPLDEASALAFADTLLAEAQPLAENG